MLLSFLRSVGRNLGALILAFLLSITVWVSAVTANDPNLEQELTRSIALEIIGQDTGLVITSQAQTQVRVRLQAPRSVWSQINSNEASVRAWIDLSALQAGNHTVPIQVQVKVRPVRVMRIVPSNTQITLEPLVTQTFPIVLRISGNTTTGYTAEQATLDPAEVSISGPLSLVSQVKEVQSSLNIDEADETITVNLPLSALDENRNTLKGLTISPSSVNVTQPIHLLGGYRNVIIKVNTEGQVANGYKLTGLTVNPINIIVFSADPQKVNDLPGYVETESVSLANATDDFETRVDLKLPEGVRAVDDSKVSVTVSIAVIESSINLPLTVEIIGLSPDHLIKVSPATIDVLLSGPVSVLNKLEPSTLHAVLDITSYVPGTYRIIPAIGILPDRIRLASLTPREIEITISLAPSATPTSTPTPTPTSTLTPTPEVTLTTPTPTSHLFSPKP